MASSVGRNTSSWLELESGVVELVCALDGVELDVDDDDDDDDNEVDDEAGDVFEAWGTVLDTPNWNGASLVILLGV